MTPLTLDIHTPTAIAAQLRTRGVDVLTSFNAYTLAKLRDPDNSGLPKLLGGELIVGGRTTPLSAETR